MLDDKDEFAASSIWAEHCLREAQSLIGFVGRDVPRQRLRTLIRYQSVVTKLPLDQTGGDWYKIVRNFMVKFDQPITEAIRAHVPQ